MSDVITILRCPVSGGALESVPSEEIARIDAAIESESLTHVDGSPAKAAFDGYLRTHDKRIHYPVRDGIMILLTDFALIPKDMMATGTAPLTSSTTLAIMRFYDEVGWKRTDRDFFYDADINESFREVSRRYIRDCHLRVNECLPRRGHYILDIASGPIQYDEYLTYSEGFEKRICCDVSFEGLRAAASRLGDKGIYIQGDITNIPLKNDAVDTFVSLHTIYHIPADRQIAAFRELERVTKPGGTGVVVYSWGARAPLAKLGGPRRAFAVLCQRLRAALHPFIPKRLLRWRRRFVADLPILDARPAPTKAASSYCFHAHSFGWYVANLAATKQWHLRAWRSVSQEFLKQRVPGNAIGRAWLATVYRLESWLPGALGRIGHFPMFVFQKQHKAV